MFIVYRVNANLNFRSSPEIAPSNITVLLPKGKIVKKVREIDDSIWWQVSTFILGEEKIGFVSSDFLEEVDINLNIIVKEHLILTRLELEKAKSLVIEIQQRFRNLGLYPGGSWIDGILGEEKSRTSQALYTFCKELDLPLPTLDNSINADIAAALIETKQIESVFNQFTG